MNHIIRDFFSSVQDYKQAQEQIKFQERQYNKDGLKLWVAMLAKAEQQCRQKAANIIANGC